MGVRPLPRPPFALSLSEGRTRSDAPPPRPYHATHSTAPRRPPAVALKSTHHIENEKLEPLRAPYTPASASRAASRSTAAPSSASVAPSVSTHVRTCQSLAAAPISPMRQI